MLPNRRLIEKLRKHVYQLQVRRHVAQNHLLVLDDLNEPVDADAVSPMNMPQGRGSACVQDVDDGLVILGHDDSGRNAPVPRR